MAEVITLKARRCRRKKGAPWACGFVLSVFDSAATSKGNPTGHWFSIGADAAVPGEADKAFALLGRWLENATRR